MIGTSAPSGKFHFGWFLFGILSMAIAVAAGICISKKLQREDQYDANGNLMATVKYKFIWQPHTDTKMNVTPPPAK